jgi:hypothetical protein
MPSVLKKALAALGCTRGEMIQTRRLAAILAASVRRSAFKDQPSKSGRSHIHPENGPWLMLMAAL